MSEDTKNNTSSIDQVATVVAATNDDTSSSLANALLGSSSDSTVNGAVLSNASTGSLSDLALANSSEAVDSLVSASSAGALSSLDQAYYAGSLQRAATFATTVTPPTQNASTYTPALSTSAWLTSVAQMSNATSAGFANIYYDTQAVGSVLSTWNSSIGNVGTGLGNVIYQQQGSLAIQGGGSLTVTQGNQLWVTGSGGSAGNIGLIYRNATGAMPKELIMGSSSYLSASGYLGGVADKNAAADTPASTDASSRTAPLATGDDVVMDIGRDWGTIGDYQAGYSAPITTIGNNNKITAGGNIGVFMNASMTVGSNTTMSVATGNGSGFFVGSGALYSAAGNNTYWIGGGMGAAYSGGATGSNGRIFLGDNVSVTLDQANYGNLAAQAGAIVSAGSAFYLRALEVSAGYGQNPYTGQARGTGNGKIYIGDNAVISLAQNGLIDDNSNFYAGKDGAIIVDGAGALVNIGIDASISARNISIGNYAKDFSGYNPTISADMTYAWYVAGSGNQMVIGSGANINLSGGIALDGNNNILTLYGGGTTVPGNILNAGSISAGNFYKAYKTALVNNSSTDPSATKYNFLYSVTTGTNFTIGDNYTITLTAGTVTTGVTNDPTITNDGNVEINQVAGIFTFGNNVNLTANSMNVGDYYISTLNPYTNTVNTFSAATSNAAMNYGTSATLNLSGAVLFDGSTNKMTFGDTLTLNASTVSFGLGVTGAGTGNIFSTGIGANITISNGFIDNFNAGNVTFGDSTTLNILAGDLALGGTGANAFTFGTSNTLALGAGSLAITNSNQVVGFGNYGTFTGSSLTLAGTTQTFSMGTNATVNLTNGITAGATGNITFGNDSDVTIGGTGFDITTSTVSVTFGTNVTYNVTAWNISGVKDSVVLGAGASGSLGDITFASTATGSLFNTGNATTLTFGTATLVNDAILTLNGTSVTGTAVNISGTGTINVLAGATVNLGTVNMDGTSQTTINVGLGATLNISSFTTANVGAANMPKININGGTVVVDGQVLRATASPVTVDFNSVNNGIYTYTGSITDASGQLTVNNFVLNGTGSSQLVFNLDSAAHADASRYITSVTGGVLYVKYVETDGTVSDIAQFTYTGTGGVPNVVITADTNAANTSGYTITITKCFLTGTHILTPEGEVTVENLQAGDMVVALQDGQQVSKRVVWAGNMDVNVNNYEHKDTLYPVRIKAHAFGLNQPCRDLLVTPEHTIYVDGGLIPARMLVNGRSIIVDTTMDRFTVYHIETEEHSILLSENLTTESYLNTEDRHLFNGAAINLHLTFNENAGHQSWENDAAAPLTVARHQVEPIWQRLDRRATQQGYALVSKPEVTRDPALCLITQQGNKIQPVNVQGNTYSFYVPANVSVVAMHSKAALPSEVVGAYLDDRRMLGVLVAKISVFGDRTFDVIPADMTGLSGWHPAELNRTDRWTKGLATLPEAVSEVSGQVKLIKIELTTTSEYFVDEIEFAEKIA